MCVIAQNYNKVEINNFQHCPVTRNTYDIGLALFFFNEDLLWQKPLVYISDVAFLLNPTNLGPINKKFNQFYVITSHAIGFKTSNITTLIKWFTV